MLAAIRLWPQLPPTSPATAECAALALTCLQHGVERAHPDMLIQAMQTLSRPEMEAQMCALSQAQPPQQHVLDSNPAAVQVLHAGVSRCPDDVAMPHKDCQQHRTQAIDSQLTVSFLASQH